MVMELYKMRYGVEISTAKEERKGVDEFGFLELEFFE